jgi:hypothetical protein
MASELVKIAADFSTTLVTKVAVGATTATLTSATDDDGVALPAGTYGFTIDRNSANKEYFTATLSGTSLTNIKTVTRGTGVGTSGFALAHRKGAEVIISDHVALKRMLDLLDGTTDFDSTNPLMYDGTATISDAKHIATKAYVDGVAIAGGADASTTIKGISKLSVAPSSASNPISVGDNDPRLPTQDENDAIAGNSGTAVSASNKLIDAADVSSSGASGKIVRANGTSLPALNGSALIGVQSNVTLTAQENISAGDSVAIGDGAEFILSSSTVTGGTALNLFGGNWVSQQFTTSATTTFIKKATISIMRGSGGAEPQNLTCSIRANSGGSPTGADIGSVTISSGSAPADTPVTYTFTFSSPVEVSPSTTYHLVFSNTGAGYSWYANPVGSTAGAAGVSTNSGSTWGTGNGPLYYSVSELDTTSGQISKTTAASSKARSNAFIGFATSSISASASGVVAVGGVVSGLSGLTPGATYYLSNTPGAISTSAGTVSRKVGIALSSTTLLIKQDNV